MKCPRCHGKGEVTEPVKSWSAEACEDWAAKFGGVPPGGPIGRALKPLVAAYGWPTVRQAWRRYLKASQAEYVSPARFSATFGVWRALLPKVIPPTPPPMVEPTDPTKIAEALAGIRAHRQAVSGA